jgi:hypothetical protein
MKRNASNRLRLSRLTIINLGRVASGLAIGTEFGCPGSMDGCPIPHSQQAGNCVTNEPITCTCPPVRLIG